jgi:RNA polymerase sigma-70 factor (ECF subfamily)
MNISITLPLAQHSIPEHNELSLLIRDCIAESKSAQKRFYDQFAPAAYGVIRRYVNTDDGLAQELLNDCFCKIFKKLGKYSFQGSFEGWIRRIVVNTVTDFLRKKIKDDRPGKEMQPEDAYVNSESVQNLSHKELLKVIETIPDTQRLVFNLFVFENYSHKEIAVLLNMNESNCRWYLNDARRRLKEKVTDLLK